MFNLRCACCSLTPSLKRCSSTNPIVICPLLHTALPVSTSNTIHHSHLTVCLPDSRSESDPLHAYRFCFGQANVNKLVPATSFAGAVEISSLRLAYETITIVLTAASLQPANISDTPASMKICPAR